MQKEGPTKSKTGWPYGQCSQLFLWVNHKTTSTDLISAFSHNLNALIIQTQIHWIALNVALEVTFLLSELGPVQIPFSLEDLQQLTFNTDPLPPLLPFR